jgi:hypothetical protein
MFRRLLLTALFLIVLGGSAFATGPLKEGSFSAQSDGSTIVLRWISEDESAVTSFEIERKAGIYGQFFLLAPVSPRGSNSSYEYVDDTAFRVGAESIYQYRIKAVLSNGSAVYSEEITVVHAVSSVRRTWGSIKAMFR